MGITFVPALGIVWACVKIWLMFMAKTRERKREKGRRMRNSMFKPLCIA
jgi:hypothetical protein